MPLQSKLNYRVKKNCVRSENYDPGTKKPSVRRALFGCSDRPTSSKKIKVSNENFNSQVESPKVNSVKQSPSLILAKQAFHTGIPSRLVGRSEEMAEITMFLTDHINKREAGSMYISGAPGTGKTSSLMSVIKNIKEKFSVAFINCMSVSSACGIYKSIAKELKLSTKVLNSKNIAKCLEKHILSSTTMTVVILDEIDHLDCKGQEVLYTLFEWPQLPNSSLILIGIANALDLTDRMLPRLQAFKYEPALMHFKPYTKEQIINILEDRLSEVRSNGSPVMQPAAIQLCARKIAANTGDIRKALDVCRRALELTENKMKKQPVLQATSDDRCNPGSPMKSLASTRCVDLQDINDVLHEVYGSRLQTSMFSSNSKTVTMPLQHMILLCTLVLMKKHCKEQDMTLGKVYDIYRRICKKREISAVEWCEFHGICRLVESRCFIQLKSAKIPRMTKVILKIEDSEAEYVLQDKTLVSAILSDCSVLFPK